MPRTPDGPIAGQSLTMEPGNAPWEQPPLYPEVQQALAFHLGNLSKPDNIEQTMFLLDQGFPLNVLVESMTSFAAMHGYHTVDVSQLINPVIHEYIKTMAEAGGIKVKEDDSPSEEEKDKIKFKSRLAVLMQKEMPEGDGVDDIGPATGLPIATDVPKEEPPVEGEEALAPSKGFISRKK